VQKELKTALEVLDMNRLYSNSNQRKDFLRSALEKYGKNENVDIAVAFFTNADYIKYLLKKNCNVRLIVRLGFPTSAQKLSEIFSLQNVNIRYFTSNTFHPKLYIFGNSVAFIGSSNLTANGIQTNQELNVLIESEEPTFEDLKIIFSQYWEAARPLTKENLYEYGAIVTALENLNNRTEQNIISQLGRVEFQNIKRIYKNKKSHIEITYDSFLKRYELFLKEFQKLKEIYESLSVRKVKEKELPLRIEVDQFLNWIRQKKAYGDRYLDAPIRKSDELKEFIINSIDEFISDDFDDIFDVIKNRYPVINNFLKSELMIESLSEDQVKKTAWIIHAFAARARYYGGKEEILEVFSKENSLDKIKNTFKYLLFGTGDFRNRIAECISIDQYKLAHFGTSCVEELYGWANDKDIPICNERTFKSMQWLGFGKM